MFLDNDHPLAEPCCRQCNDDAPCDQCEGMRGHVAKREESGDDAAGRGCGDVGGRGSDPICDDARVVDSLPDGDGDGHH